MAKSHWPNSALLNRATEQTKILEALRCTTIIHRRDHREVYCAGVHDPCGGQTMEEIAASMVFHVRWLRDTKHSARASARSRRL